MERHAEPPIWQPCDDTKGCRRNSPFADKKTEADPLTALLGRGDGSGLLVVDKPQPTTVLAKNVVGIIRGTDPVLLEEYVALTPIMTT
ncbi:MAG: hypothetical protein QM762_30460 [Chryseolinea sp.]